MNWLRWLWNWGQISQRSIEVYGAPLSVSLTAAPKTISIKGSL